MSENRKICVAITHGDTNGIGYELIFKTFAEQEMLELCTPVIYGSPKVATYHRNALNIPANFTIVNDVEEIKDGRINFIPVFDEEIKVELGVPSEESGNAGLLAVDRALEDYRKGVFDVLVTAPIDNNEQFHFSGQSRYIEDHLEVEGQGISVLINESLRVALATRNLPLKQVVESETSSTSLIVQPCCIIVCAVISGYPTHASLFSRSIPRRGPTDCWGPRNRRLSILQSKPSKRRAFRHLDLMQPTSSLVEATGRSSMPYWQCITIRESHLSAH